MGRSLKVAPAKSPESHRNLEFADFMRGIIAAIVLEQYRQRQLDVGFIHLLQFCAVLHDWQIGGKKFSQLLQEVDFSCRPPDCCYSDKLRYAREIHCSMLSGGYTIILQPSEAFGTIQQMTEEFGRRLVVSLESAAKDFLYRWHRYASGKVKHGGKRKSSRK